MDHFARRYVPADGLFATLLAVSIGLSLLRVFGGFRYAPLTAQVGPLVAGGLLLPLHRMRWLLLVTAAGVAAGVIFTPRPAGGLVSSLVAIAAAGVLGHEVARRRTRLGLWSVRADAMLVELRDRLRTQGEIPPLPAGWHADVSIRSAGGAAFAGDFIVSALRHTGPPCLEVALVDVSGKGVTAGTRALQLSGALGGLLGAIPPERFLAEANRYLLRQDWSEGFATAVHLTIDLTTGAYVLESAGHPPAAHFDQGSGRWAVATLSGPLLGVLEEVSYRPDTGVLRPGDALLLYTDGLVELPGRDIDVGIDRLLGAAERLVPRGGFSDSVGRLVDDVVTGAGDDTALVLIWRR